MAKGGGGFTYLVNLLPRLAQQASDDRFRLLVRSPRIAESLPALPNLDVDLLPEAGLRQRLDFTYREAPKLAAAWQADLYYSVGEYAPTRAPCPTLAAFRNPNIFTSLRQGWPVAQRLRLRVLRAMARMSARSCDRILFVSEDSARWIGDGLGLPEERRAVVHHGIDLDAWKPAERSDPTERRYILSVSSIYRYKNFVRLIEAWTELARRRPETPDLVIIGEDLDPDYTRRMHAARAAAGPLAERIHLLGGVPYAEVRAYYEKAALFVFPSYLETFGHPLLEAMASGLPVVAGDIPVFREIGGDAALYADPHSTPGLARAMEETLFDAATARALVKRGHEQARRFTWDRSATRLMGVFDGILRARRAPQASPSQVVASGPLARGVSLLATPASRRP